MISFLVSAFFLFIIFQNLIFNNINLPDFFTYWDEGIEIILIIFSIIVICKNKSLKIKSRNFVILMLLLIMVIIGLVGNICFGYSQSLDGIFRDIVNFLKFPLTFLLIKMLGIDKIMVKMLSKHVTQIIKFMITITFAFGIINLFVDVGMSHGSARYGIMPYKFLYSHPTYLVLSSILMLSYIQILPKSRKNLIYELMLLLTIVFTMRTKGIVVVAIFVFIKYAPVAIKKLKALYWGGAGIVGGIMAYSKLMEYTSYSTSPREVLYKGALDLIGKCFPIGSGFATYASHLSVRYESLVYEFVKVPMYKATELVYGDAGFAYYLGQFGFLGIIVGIFLAINIYKLAVDKVKDKLPIILIFIYIVVALTSETILVNNGIELAVMLAFISCKNRKEDKSKEN